MKFGFYTKDKDEAIAELSRLIYEKISDGRVWAIGHVGIFEEQLEDCGPLTSSIRYKARCAMALLDANDCNVGESGQITPEITARIVARRDVDHADDDVEWTEQIITIDDGREFSCMYSMFSRATEIKRIK